MGIFQFFLGKRGASPGVTVVKVGARVSSIDSVVNTGPFIYNETTIVQVGAHLSQTDVFGGDILEVTTARMGVQVSEARPSTVTYDETTLVQFGEHLISLDREVGNETTTVRSGIRLQQTDQLTTQGGGNIYFEITRVNAGARMAGSSQLIGLDHPTVKIGIKNPSLDVGIFADTPTVRAGIHLSSKDSQTWSMSSTVQMGGHLASTDRQIATEGTLSRMGVHGAIQEVAVLPDRTTVRLGIHASSSTPGVNDETTTARTGVHVASIDVLIAADSATVRAGGHEGNRDALIAADRTIVDVGFQMSGSQGRAILETTAVRMGGKLQSTDRIIALESTLARLGFKMASGRAALDPSGLIPAIRRTTDKTLTELTVIPEALPSTAEFAKTLIPPYLVIVAGTPEADTSFGVHDQAHWVPVDLVYVAPTKLDGATDMPQYLRGRLRALVSALLQDYTQTGGLPDSPSAVNTEVTAVSMERQTEYQKHFAEVQQQVTVMIASMSFLVMESTDLAQV